MTAIELVISAAHIGPHLKVSLTDVLMAARLSANSKERKLLTRKSVREELEARGFASGLDANGARWVVGLSLSEPPKWAVRNDRVVKV